MAGVSVLAFRDGKTWPLVQQQVGITNTKYILVNGNTDYTIVPANYSRKYIQITNNNGPPDSPQQVYLAFGIAATLHQGIRLGSYNTEYYTYMMDRESIYTGEIHAKVTGSAGVNVTVSILEASG